MLGICHLSPTLYFSRWEDACAYRLWYCSLMAARQGCARLSLLPAKPCEVQSSSIFPCVLPEAVDGVSLAGFSRGRRVA